MYTNAICYISNLLNNIKNNHLDAKKHEDITNALKCARETIRDLDTIKIDSEYDWSRYIEGSKAYVKFRDALLNGDKHTFIQYHNMADKIHPALGSIGTIRDGFRWHVVDE